MSDITFVGFGVASATDVQTDLNVDLPGASPGDDIEPGDVALIIYRHNRTGATFVPGSGFTEERWDLQIEPGANLLSGIATKRLTGDETTITLDYDPESLDADQGAIMLVYRGANPIVQLDNASTENDDADGQGNDSTPFCPPIAPQTPTGVLILAHLPEAGATDYTAFLAPTTPSGMSAPMTVIPVNGNVVHGQIIVSHKLDYGAADLITPTVWLHTFTGSAFRGFRTYSIVLRAAHENLPVFEPASHITEYVRM